MNQIFLNKIENLSSEEIKKLYGYDHYRNLSLIKNNEGILLKGDYKQHLGFNHFLNKYETDLLENYISEKIHDERIESIKTITDE